MFYFLMDDIVIVTPVYSVMVSPWLSQCIRPLFRQGRRKFWLYIRF